MGAQEPLPNIESGECIFLDPSSGKGSLYCVSFSPSQTKYFSIHLGLESLLAKSRCSLKSRKGETDPPNDILLSFIGCVAASWSLNDVQCWWIIHFEVSPHRGGARTPFVVAEDHGHVSYLAEGSVALKV